jgi:hypothetical protein
MPIKIPNVSVARSLTGLGTSLLGLSRNVDTFVDRQNKLEIKNENAANMRIMLDDLQTFNQNYALQKNKQAKSFFVNAIGEQAVNPHTGKLDDVDSSTFNSDWYSYSLSSGEKVTGAGDDIIRDYADKLWQEKFSGQFSSEESEKLFRQSYDAQIAKYSGEFRVKNFNYRQQNEAEAIGRELTAIESNPQGLSIPEAMKGIQATTQKSFEGGLITNQQRIDQNAKSEYVLLTGETWNEASVIAAGDGSGELSPEQNVQNAKDHIYGKEGLLDTEKDSIWAKLENQHNEGVAADKDFFTESWTNKSIDIRARIKNGQITTKNAVEDALQNESYILPYSRDPKIFPNQELNFLKSLIDEKPDPEKLEDRDKYVSGNEDYYREQMNLMLQNEASENEIVRMFQGATDMFYDTGGPDAATGENIQGMSATEQNKLRAELQKQGEARFALSTDAAFQAVVADGIESLISDDKNVTDTAKRLYEEEATRYASTVNGASGSTGNATPAMVAAHMEAYTEAITLKAVGEIDLRNTAQGGRIGRARIDAAEAYHQLGEQGKISYDEGLARDAINELLTPAEMRARYYADFGEYDTLTDEQKAQVNNVEVVMEVAALSREKFNEEFDASLESVTLHQGIPYTIDEHGTTFKLDFKDNNKSLDYQYLKPLRENKASPKRREFDVANPGKKAGRIIYGNTVDEDNLDGVTN